MKRIIFTLAASIFALSLIASDENSLVEFKREVTRTFSTGANTALQIENRFGNIRIVEGADNQITFSIEIIGKGATEARAKEYAETVSIESYEDLQIKSGHSKIKAGKSRQGKLIQNPNLMIFR